MFGGLEFHFLKYKSFFRVGLLILIVLVLRFTHYTLHYQRAPFDPFLEHQYQIFHTFFIDLFGFNPEKKKEKCSKFCITPIIGFSSLKNKVLSSV